MNFQYICLKTDLFHPRKNGYLLPSAMVADRVSATITDEVLFLETSLSNRYLLVYFYWSLASNHTELDMFVLEIDFHAKYVNFYFLLVF